MSSQDKIQSLTILILRLGVDRNRVRLRLGFESGRLRGHQKSLNFGTWTWLWTSAWQYRNMDRGDIILQHVFSFLVSLFKRVDALIMCQSTGNCSFLCSGPKRKSQLVSNLKIVNSWTERRLVTRDPPVVFLQICNQQTFFHLMTHQNSATTP